MNKIRTVAAIIGATFILSTGFSAAQQTTVTGEKTQQEQDRKQTNEDPIKRLQEMKESIAKKAAEGKIDQKKADEITAKINEKIKQLEELNKLAPAQKKEKLKSMFKDAIDKKVNDGKLTRDKADEIIKKHNEKIDKWDGQGYPPVNFKGTRHIHKDK